MEWGTNRMRALLSVYDKSNIVELARGLIDLGYEIVSTGGTLRAVEAAGVPVLAVAEVTGSPEILDGRVKTLHPAIHGGLLARRDDPAHLASLAAHDIAPIDLVAVNLYPFAQTIAAPDVTLTDALEQIDIGGPTMIRAAAKNFPDVIVLTNPADYRPVLDALRTATVTLTDRRRLAARAFAHVAAYDAVVADYLRDDEFPIELAVAGDKVQDLRYGENPQQRAAAYRRRVAGVPRLPRLGVLDAVQLAGKELSFNNLLDADAAWSAATAFPEPTVAIVKHAIPCGLAGRDALAEAFSAALEGDPVSAFGGIVAANRQIDGETARQLAEVFFEVVIAPGFDDEARDALVRRKQLRLLDMPAPESDSGPPPWDLRLIGGGFLVQDADDAADDPAGWRVVTQAQPDAAAWNDLRFAWRAVRFVKSNAIVLARDRALVGVGSGQPNRLVSVRLATAAAGDRAQGAALASDAFFPFADGVEAALAAGVTAIIQPGGSVRDAEVIAAADAAGVSMVFTGIRHFRH
jgi:phosphoribosylaminoimidazolecarboxamide formyltransferase/IMP cyclohydrolase